MVLSGETLSAKLSSTTLRTLVKALRLCFISSSDVAEEAPMIDGPYMPPSMEQTKIIAGATKNERRRAAKREPPNSSINAKLKAADRREAPVRRLDESINAFGA